MLRTTCPNISVITNFGCHSNCWYCIWKGHELEHVKKETDWEKLEAFLDNYRDLGKVSVSGGGDPLYCFEEHANWWSKFLHMTKQKNMVVDVHTREKFKCDSFWKRINRCAFSSDMLTDDYDHLLYLSALTKLRITHLVTAKTTLPMIEEYLSFARKHQCQLTIKQLVGYDDAGTYEAVRREFPGIYHLDIGDYNIYYMPDNTVRCMFLPEEYNDNVHGLL